jgi:hypothetical protein
MGKNATPPGFFRLEGLASSTFIARDQLLTRPEIDKKSKKMFWHDLH